MLHSCRRHKLVHPLFDCKLHIVPEQASAKSATVSAELLINRAFGDLDISDHLGKLFLGLKTWS